MQFGERWRGGVCPQMIDVRQTPVVGHPQIAPPDCGELGEGTHRSLRGRGAGARLHLILPRRGVLEPQHIHQCCHLIWWSQARRVQCWEVSAQHLPTVRLQHRLHPDWWKDLAQPPEEDGRGERSGGGGGGGGRSPCYFAR